MLRYASTGLRSSNGLSKRESGEQTLKTITTSAARDLMATNDDFVLLDVRSLEEHREVRIAGAICIPHTELEARAPVELAEKDQVIIVHCKGGSRSAEACGTLVKLGYTNIYDMGGIMSWPYETVSG